MIDSLSDLPHQIRQGNLTVYAAVPGRFFEDITSEAEVAHDYQGRLVYELLQNADDAMAKNPNQENRVWFRLTDQELWVGNSGRTLNEGDIRGLTSTGAGTKATPKATRRASIGHKGMGFKSILELTDRPEVYSHSCCFVMDGQRAIESVGAILKKAGFPAPLRVPTMRFPWEVLEPPAEWVRESGNGINVLFRFPFKDGIKGDKLEVLADTLANLPVTTILFLKHLEHVHIEIETLKRRDSLRWSLARKQKDGAGRWTDTDGLSATGIYQVDVNDERSNESEKTWRFLLAHDADVDIEQHRGGLNQYAWEGVSLTEVTVAALVNGTDDCNVPKAWRKLHVFLPTQEVCPYPFLVNGAFATDLSRKNIATIAEADDYNTYLLEKSAQLFRDQLIPEFLNANKSALDVVQLLDRDPDLRTNAGGAAQTLHRKMVDVLSDFPILPISDSSLGSDSSSSEKVAFQNAVVPFIDGDANLGSDIRNLLHGNAIYENFRLPSATCCSESLARIALDHGTKALEPAQLAVMMARADPSKVHLGPHSSGKLEVDPLLAVIERIWRSLTGANRDAFVRAVRENALFPVAVLPTGEIQRIIVGKQVVFYPSRSLRADVPLDGLRFLLQEVCWGNLTRTERNSILGETMPIWQSLFDLREFKFPDVMRASVLPLLDLDGDPDTQRIDGTQADRRRKLQDPTKLAAICQLSGSTTKPSIPLPYERLGSQRALFNLCRLPVPCRVGKASDIVWVPAYRAYFGREWIGPISVEEILDVVSDELQEKLKLDIPILIGPEYFKSLLEKYKGLRDITAFSDVEVAVQDDSEEVSPDEDEDLAIEENEKDRWMAFLTWLGVNKSLRPVHFHDAEEIGKTWLKTRNLSRSGGWAFEGLGQLWEQFYAAVSERVKKISVPGPVVPYFYRLHHLQYLEPILKIAQADATRDVAKRLYVHLAAAWPELQRFAETQVALVPEGKWPGARTAPPHAHDEELHYAGDDFWLFRLKHSAWCPTSQGNRKPDQTWIPSKEIKRRFDRKGSSSEEVLPILDAPGTSIEGKARGLSLALGLRDDLTASTFEIADAKAFLTCIASLFPENKLPPRPDQLRHFIRPAYQNLFELLSGAVTKARNNQTDLSESPILVHDGAGNYKFVQAKDALYARRSGQRELLGLAEPLWTFVLEARPSAESPLRTLFRTPVLEEAIEWAPQPGESSLAPEDIEVFRSGLRSVAPYLLARLRAERTDDALAIRDAKLLGRFVKDAFPCHDLTVTCQLQGQKLDISRRSSFVRQEPFEAFIVWGGNPWPPTNEEAEALATAITELLDVTYFEPLLALLTHTDGRDRLLHLAGASGNLEIARDMLRDDFVDTITDDSVDEGSSPLPKAPVNNVVEPETENSVRPWDIVSPIPVPRTPLLQLSDLTFDGVPILVSGQPYSASLNDPKKSGSENNSSPSGQTQSGRPDRLAGYGGGTDLDELDRLGMSIAMNFERVRMLSPGLSCFMFDPDNPDAGATIFDVSTRTAVDAAIAHSANCKKIFEFLARLGVSVDAPGFDILTLDPLEEDGIGRLIELKSSGYNARTQSMSVNEWRTASVDVLRSRYYLYLVGNLRADLPDATPFVRGICNPFGSLFGQEKSASSARRSVQLNVLEFDKAEFLELGVSKRSQELSES
jgi:hypothetical protein